MITELNIIITVTGVPIVEMSLTLLDDQEVIGIDLGFVKVFFMLNKDIVSFLGILLARLCSLSSFRLEMFRDCIMLKLSIFE